MSEVKHLLSVQNAAGESPIWVSQEKALYWVDCEGAKAFRLPAAKPEGQATAAKQAKQAKQAKAAKQDKHANPWQTFEADLPVTAIGRRASGGWIAATKKGLAFWDGRSGHFELIVDPEKDNPDHRCNDIAVDRKGRLWLGTMNQKDLFAATGSLWRLDKDLSLHRIDGGFAVPNGIGFSPDDKTMYVTDMFHGKIVAYDFDLGAGTVSSRRDFAKLPAEAGIPDGLIVDREGCVWSAHWGGWRVTRYRPDGSIDRDIRLPAANVTCMAFGGAALDELYITTAWVFLTDPQRKEQPQAGDLFRVALDVQGIEEPAFAG